MAQLYEPGGMSIVSHANGQPTDLMHRRLELDLSGTFFWQSVMVRIETNSRAILRAAPESGLTPITGTHARLRSRWELTVEEDAAAAEPAGSACIWRDSQSVFIEMAERQWFALDIDNGEGAGFLSAEAPELVAHRYLKAVLSGLLPVFKNPSWIQGFDD